MSYLYLFDILPIRRGELAVDLQNKNELAEPGLNREKLHFFIIYTEIETLPTVYICKLLLLFITERFVDPRKVTTDFAKFSLLFTKSSFTKKILGRC